MDFKSAGSSSKNNLDSEKSVLERFETKYKNTYFWALFVVLKEEDSSLILALVGSIILFFQQLIFPFHPSIKSIWAADDIHSVINLMTRVVEMNYWFKTTNWTLYIAVFYAALFLILFVKFNIFYVSYSFSKKKFSFMWTVYTLKAFFSLFTTIFFYPFFDYFISMMSCAQTNDGKYVHIEFTEIECWQGAHILHSVFAIFAALCFVETAYVVCICYFECKSSANVPTARTNARANFLLLLYESLMVIALTFMRGKDYHYIILIFILGGSLIIFFKFHFNSPYYNEKVAKMWSCLMSINLWTAIMICFAKFMEGTLFEGSLVAWIIGIPFIVLIVITNRDHRIDLLLINVNKFQSGEELQNQIRFILKLIHWQSTNKNAAILLDGYVEIHKQTCNKEDCPLKQKNMKNNIIPSKNLAANDETSGEKYSLLIQLLNKMYFYGLKKFPNNTSLRIAYAFFLIENLNLNQQALQELNTAEQNKPPFDEQFIIFRYRKIIEDEIAESKNEKTGRLDVVSELAFKTHLGQCQANIEKSAMLHMEFWSQLEEDNPDINKLNDVGINIHNSVSNVEDHWAKLQKISPNMPKAMKLYGKFLTEIINDKEAGEEFLERARNIINLNSHKKGTAIQFNGNEDISDNSTPTVFVSGDIEKLGIVISINHACSSVFGYNKSELINRNIKILMPPLYAKNHDDYLETYIQTNEARFINKERFVFGKHKSGYMTPVFANIKPINNNYQALQFAATFRTEKYFKPIAYLLIYHDGLIDCMNAVCISLLKIDAKLLQKKPRVTDFLPELIAEKDKYLVKTGDLITYSYPKDSSDYVEGQDLPIQMHCTMTQILLSSMDKNKPGYVIKLEKHVGAKENLGHRRHAPCNFKFKYSDREAIIGEFDDNPVDDLKSDNEYNESIAQLRSTLAEKYSVYTKKDEDGEIIKERPNYAEGISTMRLLRDGNLSEYFNDHDSELSDLSDDDGGRDNRGNWNKDENFDDPEDNFSVSMFDSTFKTRKQLNDVLGNDKMPGNIKCFNIIGHCLIVALLILAVVEYFVTLREFNQINENIRLINLSYERIAELENIVSKSRNVVMAQMGIVASWQGNDKKSAEEEWKKSIAASIDGIERIQKSLQLETIGISLSDPHEKLLTQNVVVMKHLSGEVLKFDLNEATKQIVAKTFTFKETPVEKITETNTDLYFITYNSFNEYYIGLRNSSRFYVQELEDKTNNKVTTFLIFLFAAFVVTVCGLAVLIPCLYHIERQKSEILGIFLDIPEEKVKMLKLKCEKFISNLQVGEDDDAISEVDEMSVGDKEDEEDIAENLLRGKRKKRSQPRCKANRCYLSLMLLFGVLVMGYFGLNFYFNFELITDIRSMVKEVDATGSAESFFYFSNNAQRQLLLNKQQTILVRNPLEVVMENINLMFELDSQIHEEHSINVAIHNDEYKQIYNNLMMLKPCEIASTLKGEAHEKDIQVKECEEFAAATLKEGLALGLARHYENMRYILTKYLAFEADPNLAWNKLGDVECNKPAGTTKTNQEWNKLCLNLIPQAYEIDQMQNLYIKRLFRYLVSQLQSEITKSHENKSQLSLVLMVGLLILMVLVYLILWLPLISRLTSEFIRTRSMLTMIPKSIIRNISSVRNYVKACMNDYNVANYQSSCFLSQQLSTYIKSLFFYLFMSMIWICGWEVSIYCFGGLFFGEGHL